VRTVHQQCACRCVGERGIDHMLQYVSEQLISRPTGPSLQVESNSSHHSVISAAFLHQRYTGPSNERSIRPTYAYLLRSTWLAASAASSVGTSARRRHVFPVSRVGGRAGRRRRRLIGMDRKSDACVQSCPCRRRRRLT